MLWGLSLVLLQEKRSATEHKMRQSASVACITRGLPVFPRVQTTESRIVRISLRISCYVLSFLDIDCSERLENSLF